MNKRRQSGRGIRDVKHLANAVVKRVARHRHFLCALSVDVGHFNLDWSIVEPCNDLFKFSLEIRIRSLASLICSAISEHSIDCILHTTSKRERNLRCRWCGAEDRYRTHVIAMLSQVDERGR